VPGDGRTPRSEAQNGQCLPLSKHLQELAARCGRFPRGSCGSQRTAEQARRLHSGAQAPTGGHPRNGRHLYPDPTGRCARELPQKLPEDAWQRLDGTTEWAEVNIVPSRFGYSKKDPQLRFLALRQKVETPTTAVFSFNLQRLMTHHLLPAGWARVHQKRLPATIYSSPAGLIQHSAFRSQLPRE